MVISHYEVISNHSDTSQEEVLVCINYVQASRSLSVIFCPSRYVVTGITNKILSDEYMLTMLMICVTTGSFFVGGDVVVVSSICGS